jgi:hypothetical protein
MGGGNKSKPEETAVEAVDRSRGDPMIETVVIYFIFLIHWLELTFGTAMSTGIKGVSLGNLSVALAVLGWLLSIAFKRANFQWSNMYYFILLLVWVVAMSIPYKALHGDFRHVSMLREIVTFKNWVQPYLLLVLVFNLAHSKTIAKRITVGLMIYVMLSVLVTILVVTDTFLIGAIQIERGGHWPRFSGPNTYAAFLVLMSPLFFFTCPAQQIGVHTYSHRWVFSANSLRPYRVRFQGWFSFICRGGNCVPLAFKGARQDE